MEHIIIGHSFEITLDTENSSLLALKVFLKKFPSLLDTCKDVHICCLSVSNKPSLPALLPSHKKNPNLSIRIAEDTEILSFHPL